MILVIYKCYCMKEPVEVPVRERAMTEAIEKWMPTVVAAISRDHMGRSPLCRRTKMEFAKLPLNADGSPVGTRRVH